MICGDCGRHLNGKSAHGKTQKHHYYYHNRILNAIGIPKHKCQIQRVRAVKFEEMIHSSLKSILSQSSLIDQAIATYESANNKELPFVESRLKTVASEIKSHQKTAQNIMQRIEELPPELSAELFYKRLTEIKKKMQELKAQKLDLETLKIKTTSSGGLRKLDQGSC